MLDPTVQNPVRLLFVTATPDSCLDLSEPAGS